MNPTVIVVDIGNTSTGVALARDNRIGPVTRLPTRPNHRALIRQALARLIRRRPAAGSMLCSVAPAMNALWLTELRRVTGRAPLVLQYRLKLGIAIDYPRPATIGADRLANASAAAERYGPPVIVADFGTALTFDVVSAAGAYVGGVIAPGLPLMTDYLAERTALLPRLSLADEPLGRRPLSRLGAIGRSTRAAMIIGARRGYLGMVREIIFSLQRELRNRRIRLCATGGYASWALAGSGLPIRIDPDLTLYGLNRIYWLNQ